MSVGEAYFPRGSDDDLDSGSRRGPAIGVSNVAECITGAPIRGNWWGHRAGTETYAVLNLLDESGDLASTRLIDDKITMLHARVWPSIVRVSAVLGVERLAAIHSEHTASGAHRSFEVDLPRWVPAEAQRAAELLSVDEGFANLSHCQRAEPR